MQSETASSKWIDEYSLSLYQAFTNMVPNSYGPLDYLITFFGPLNATFIEKLHAAVATARSKDLSQDDLVACFPSASALNAAIFFLIQEYAHSDRSHASEAREIFDYFIPILERYHKGDTWIHDRNIVHTADEIKEILHSAEWSKESRETAREVGKLNNSASALAYSLYRDYFPQISQEIYGPYDASEKFGRGAVMLIKMYPKLKPLDLWPNLRDLDIPTVRVLQVYRNVSFRFEAWGLHMLSDGDAFGGQVAFEILLNNKRADMQQIKDTSTRLAEIATRQSSAYDSMTTEEVKVKFLEWTCYQFFDLFTLLGIDWKPTQKMLVAMHDKHVDPRFAIDSVGTYEEFCADPKWGIQSLKKLYND